MTPNDQFNILPFWIRKKELDLDTLFSSDPLPPDFNDIARFINADPPVAPAAVVPPRVLSSNESFIAKVVQAAEARLPQAPNVPRFSDVRTAKNSMRAAVTRELNAFLDEGPQVWIDAKIQLTDKDAYKSFFLLPATRKKYPFTTFLAIRYGFVGATTCVVERLFSIVSLLTYRRGRYNAKVATLYDQLILILAKTSLLSSDEE